MERLMNYKTDLTKIYNLIGALDERVDILWYLRFYELELNNNKYFINAVSNVDEDKTISIPNGTNTVYLINVKSTHKIKISAHNANVICDNCYITDLTIDGQSDFYFNNCYIKKLEVDELKSDFISINNYFEEVKIMGLDGNEHKIDLASSTSLKKFTVNEVIPMVQYNLNISISNSVNELEIKGNGIELYLNMVDNSYHQFFNKFLINVRSIQALHVHNSVDLFTVSYDESKYKIQFNPVFTYYIGNLNIDAMLLCLFKNSSNCSNNFNCCQLVLYNPLLTSDVKLDPTQINQSWGGAPGQGSTTWRFSKIHGVCLYETTWLDMLHLLQEVCNPDLSCPHDGNWISGLPEILNP